jgi:hypothetical protein
MKFVSTGAAITRLQEREAALTTERQRIAANAATALAAVDAQLAAVQSVLVTLRSPAKAAIFDSVLTDLEKAGVRLEVPE